MADKNNVKAVVKHKDFLSAMSLYNKHQYAQAASSLKSLKDENFEDYKNYFLGNSYYALEEKNFALMAYQEAADTSKIESLRSRALLKKAMILNEQKKWKKSGKIFKSLQSSLKRTSHYGDVLWGYLQSLLGQGKSNSGSPKVCRLAKELYLKYPHYPQTLSWSVFLKKNYVGEYKLRCKTRLTEIKLRQRRLLWAGMQKKAFEELQEAKASQSFLSYKVDRLIVEYHLSEGYPQQAEKILLAYEKKHYKEFDYQILKGKVMSRNHKVNKALRAFRRAYKASNKKTDQARSQFNIAYLYYKTGQNKEASKEFSVYNKKFPTSYEAKNSQWYAAWTSYLAKDYVVAGQRLTSLLKKVMKNPRYYRQHPLSKIKYWLAMTWLRQGLKERASGILTDLTQDDNIGYYSIAAYHRLGSLKEKDGKLLSQTAEVHENWWLPDVIASSDSDETLLEDTAMLQADRWIASVEGVDSTSKRQSVAESQGLLEPINETGASPQLLIKIDQALNRAEVLIEAEQFEFAQSELYRVEQRNMKAKELKVLIDAHIKASSYYRPLVLASRHYQSNQKSLGVHHGSELWRYSYPRAFEGILERSLKKAPLVSKEFVWSIMRAETLFKPGAVSPVGARGLMQIMPHTGRKLASLTGSSFNLQKLDNPNVSIPLGSFYLNRLLKKFNKKLPLAAASYNGGPHRVHAWIHYFGDIDMDEFIEHIPFKETRNYVKKVSKYVTVYNLLYNKDTSVTGFLSQPVGVALEGTIPTRETWERL